MPTVLVVMSQGRFLVGEQSFPSLSSVFEAYPGYKVSFKVAPKQQKGGRKHV